MNTLKVKPWGKDQGDFVLINESDFDADKHQRLDEEKPEAVSKSKKSKTSKE